MDIIRDSLMKAKATKRESIRALKSNGFVAPTPEEPSETSEAGPLNPNRAQPTQRTQTPAFIHAQQRLRDSGVTLPGRARGQPGVSAPLHPPKYASGRGLRGLESLEATTLGASSMNSELSIGIGRGRSRGRGFGRGTPRIPAVSEGKVVMLWNESKHVLEHAMSNNALENYRYSSLTRELIFFFSKTWLLSFKGHRHCCCKVVCLYCLQCTWVQYTILLCSLLNYRMSSLLTSYAMCCVSSNMLRYYKV